MGIQSDEHALMVDIKEQDCTGGGYKGAGLHWW